VVNFDFCRYPRVNKDSLTFDALNYFHEMMMQCCLYRFLGFFVDYKYSGCRGPMERPCNLSQSLSSDLVGPVGLTLNKFTELSIMNSVKIHGYLALNRRGIMEQRVYDFRA